VSTARYDHSPKGEALRSEAEVKRVETDPSKAKSFAQAAAL
jgi:hypothetical protein